MPKPELVDLTMRMHHGTDLAVKVSDDGDEAHAVWLARSQIEIEIIRDKPGYVEITCPAWLARDKGLI